MSKITEELEKKITSEMESKHREAFEKIASYKGNGVYGIAGGNLVSTDTRELFLMFIALRENISFETEDDLYEEEEAYDEADSCITCGGGLDGMSSFICTSCAKLEEKEQEEEEM